MNKLKYYYLFDKNGILTHIDKAVKGETYYYEHSKIEFIVRYNPENPDGYRKHYALKNSFNSLSIGVGGGGESEEHYNAKMKIANDLTYFDDIFDADIYFHKVISEKKINNKIPDLSCYDENDNLIMAIEIYYSNKKNETDILELKKLGIPIVEIDINHDNKCKHIVLTKVLETNQQKLREVKRLFKESSFKIKEKIAEAKREYRDFAEEHSPDINSFKEAISLYEGAIQTNGSKRIHKIKKWLQRRLNRNREKESFTVRFERTEDELKNRIRKFRESSQRELTEFKETSQGELTELTESIKRGNRKIQVMQEETYKNDYRIGKYESEIKRIESEIEARKHDIRALAKNCKIEWVRCSWMTGKVSNHLEEIRYWNS